MNEAIQILNIEIQNIRANKAIKKVAEYFGTDSLSTIEFVSMDTLVQAESNQELQEAISEIDFVVPGEAEILKAADIKDDVRLKEIEEGTFWQMIARNLEKHRRRIFVLAESEDILKESETYIQTRYRGIKLVGMEVLSEEESAAELVVNKINGAGADCVIGFLSTPKRELFIRDNKAMMNTKVWISIEKQMIGRDVVKKGILSSFATKLLFRHKVGQEKKDN